MRRCVPHLYLTPIGIFSWKNRFTRHSQVLLYKICLTKDLLLLLFDYFSSALNQNIVAQFVHTFAQLCLYMSRIPIRVPNSWTNLHKTRAFKYVMFGELCFKVFQIKNDQFNLHGADAKSTPSYSFLFLLSCSSKIGPKKGH